MDKRRKYNLNERFFDQIDTEEKAYVLGLLYADGCVWDNDIQLKLKHEDLELLEKVRNILYNDERPINKKYDGFLLRVCSRYMVESLKKVGCVERKTDKIRFPFWLNKNLYKHFMRGYFDGDGSLYKVHGKNYHIYHIKFVSKNGLFAEDMLKLLKKFKPTSRLQKPSMTYATEIRRQKETVRFLNWIYQDCKISLARKFKRYIECIENFNLKKKLLSKKQMRL